MKPTEIVKRKYIWLSGRHQVKDCGKSFCRLSSTSSLAGVTDAFGLKKRSAQCRKREGLAGGVWALRGVLKATADSMSRRFADPRKPIGAFSCVFE